MISINNNQKRIGEFNFIGVFLLLFLIIFAKLLLHLLLFNIFYCNMRETVYKWDTRSGAGLWLCNHVQQSTGGGGASHLSWLFLCRGRIWTIEIYLLFFNLMGECEVRSVLSTIYPFLAVLISDYLYEKTLAKNGEAF